MKERIKDNLGLIIVTLIILVDLIPIPISKTYKALEIKTDYYDYCEEVEVKIKGKYYFNIFSKDKFKGKIIISNYEGTKNNSVYLTVSKEGHSLEYIYKDSDEKDNDKTFFFGRLYSKGLFRNSIITIYDTAYNDKEFDNDKIEDKKSWNEENGYALIFEADDRDEAMKMLIRKNIIKKYKK